MSTVPSARLEMRWWLLQEMNQSYESKFQQMEVVTPADQKQPSTTWTITFRRYFPVAS